MQHKALYEKAHFGAHCSYLGAVSWEAHGLYGIMAFILLVVMVYGAVFGSVHE